MTFILKIKYLNIYSSTVILIGRILIRILNVKKYKCVFKINSKLFVFQVIPFLKFLLIISQLFSKKKKLFCIY